MRKSVSTLAILATLVFAGQALADSPAEVYSDFATDGVLDCGHSQTALRGALTDASFHQYGDPLTFIQMKLAIRKQLAGSCRRTPSATPDGSAGGYSGEAIPLSGGSAEASATKHGAGEYRSEVVPKADGSTRTATPRLKSNPAVEKKQSGGMILLGIGLLLLTLATGGWAARQAFGDKK